MTNNLKNPNYTEQITEFANEVNKLALTQDRRQMILLLGIYSEYVVNELIKIKLPKSGLNKISSHSIKLKILLSHNIISDKTYPVFEKLNYVRNEYAHNLLFDSKKIESWALETPLNWKFDKTDETALKKIDESLKKDIFDRFYKICISNIIFLFQDLDKWVMIESLKSKMNS